MVAASELPIETVREGTTALDMANEIFGNSVTVTGATYYSDIDSAGIYSGGDTTSPGVVPGPTGVIMSTGEAEDFTNDAATTVMAEMAPATMETQTVPIMETVAGRGTAGMAIPSAPTQTNPQAHQQTPREQTISASTIPPLAAIHMTRQPLT